MNYRHAFHAGNFADVMKHAVLALVIAHLKHKDTPFRVIDTHAGVGRYELTSGPAERTGEWRNGIGRLLGPNAQALPAAIEPLLAPYLDSVRNFNRPGGLTVYPGSPMIARTMLRAGDILAVNELHPDDGRRLAALFRGDRQVKVSALDGWIALKALLPPKERRGVVLIDPPFEQPGELIRLTEGLAEAVRRFATGIYLLWYPIKDEKPIQRFHRALAELALPKLLVAELLIRPARNPEVLSGSGLAMLNPPYQLETMLETLLPYLASVLAESKGAGHRLKWL